MCLVIQQSICSCGINSFVSMKSWWLLSFANSVHGIKYVCKQVLCICLDYTYCCSHRTLVDMKLYVEDCLFERQTLYKKLCLCAIPLQNKLKTVQSVFLSFLS